jgi:hypothetical protein
MATKRCLVESFSPYDARGAGVSRDHEVAATVRIECDTEPVDWKLAPMIGRRVDHDDRVLAYLDYVIEVADRSLTDGLGEWAVRPHGSPPLSRNRPTRSADVRSS